MTKILTNVVISQRGTATTTDEKYNYGIDYEVVNGQTLKSINVNVTNKETGAYAGNMSYRDNNKNFSAPETSDINALLKMLDATIAEVSEELHGTTEVKV